MTDTEMIATLRALHAPAGNIHPTCDGCDIDDWEGSAPDWPCSSALLLYTDTERASILTSASEAAEQRKREMKERRLSHHIEVDKEAQRMNERDLALDKQRPKPFRPPAWLMDVQRPLTHDFYCIGYHSSDGKCQRTLR